MAHPLKKLFRRTIQVFGYDIQSMSFKPFASPYNPGDNFDTSDLPRIQYACGPKFLKDWVNVDFYPKKTMKRRFTMPDDVIYYQVDLSLYQPFQNESFAYAFSEDFIEHICQADSLIFLNECYRILKKSGVLRLSFPCLEGVLRRHFNSTDYLTLLQGREDAYDLYRHLHFYSREELSLVARHIGFSRIEIVSFGQSTHEALRDLETRDEQLDLNYYVELTK